MALALTTLDDREDLINREEPKEELRRTSRGVDDRGQPDKYGLLTMPSICGGLEDPADVLR